MNDQEAGRDTYLCWPFRSASAHCIWDRFGDPALLLGCLPLTKVQGGWITPTFWVFPFHNIEEAVMRLFLVALLFVVSSSAVAQVSQNPEACALLRAYLDHVRPVPGCGDGSYGLDAGDAPQDWDPCYWPPPHQQR